jgi:hypothetical protein
MSQLTLPPSSLRVADMVEAEKSEVFRLKVLGVAIVYFLSRRGPRSSDFNLFPGLDWYYEKIKTMYSELVRGNNPEVDFFEGSEILLDIWVYWKKP